jgi:hypothetical protein
VKLWTWVKRKKAVQLWLGCGSYTLLSSRGLAVSRIEILINMPEYVEVHAG